MAITKAGQRPLAPISLPERSGGKIISQRAAGARAGGAPNGGAAASRHAFAVIFVC